MNILIKPIVAALALTVCHAGFASLIVGENPGGKASFKGDSAFEWLNSLNTKIAAKKNDPSKSKYLEPDLINAVISLSDNKHSSLNGKKVIDDLLVRVKLPKNDGGKSVLSDYKCLNRGSCDNAKVSEPGTVALLGIGMLGLALTRRHYSK